jgi:hypothetical protein
MEDEQQKKSVYKKAIQFINQNNTAFVCALLLIAAIVIVIYSVFRIKIISTFSPDAKEIAAEILSPIIFSVIVTICFAIFDRLGILLPVERRIGSLIEQIRSDGSDAKVGLAQAIRALEQYAKYRNARLVGGMVGIPNLSVIDPTHLQHSEIVSRDMLSLVIESAAAGSTIYYMNTVVERDPGIEAAVKRGVKVKLLVMDPDDDIQVRARFNDIREHTTYQPLGFKPFLRQRAFHLCEIRDLFNKRHEATGGSLEVRFFEGSLNYPLLAILEGEINERAVVYTGFYGSYSSEEMPYIEWREGTFRARQKFLDIFEHKWEQSTKLAVEL